METTIVEGQGVNKYKVGDYLDFILDPVTRFALLILPQAEGTMDNVYSRGGNEYLAALVSISTSN